jgi:hypothetical protein
MLPYRMAATSGTAEPVAAYLGVVPNEHQSGHSIQRRPPGCCVIEVYTPLSQQCCQQE